MEIPASKKLDDEDTYFITKFKVIFENFIVKIIHPIDLIHYIFHINEKIIIKDGSGVINSDNFLIKDGSISYEVLFSNGKLTQVSESEIISKYITPIKKIFLRKVGDPPKNFLIKFWAQLFHSYYSSYQVKCITNSRLSLMPHQINVAHRLSEEYFPRVILADEVGLGKTIEAGIFIKEMMARNLAERVLIIVPASLVHQWKFEMDNKFQISFEIYDGKKIKELRKKGNHKSAELLQNPFYYDNLIISSLQFARNPKYIELLSQISWDIIVFDEAHHLRRYLQNISTGNYRETLNYKLARNLSSSTESMLLLTATPLQLHSFELLSLIELIQREAFDNFSDFENFRKNMPFINLLISNIDQIDKLNNFEVKNTIRLLKNLQYIDKNRNNNRVLELLKLSSFKRDISSKIEKDHTLSKFLIRNRKKNVFSKEFLNKRIAKTIMVHPSNQELDIYNEIRLYLAKIYNSSISKENAGIGFIVTTLQKLLTSSKFAFLKSLERRMEQIQRYKTLAINIDRLKEEDPEYYELELEEVFLDNSLSDNGDLIKEQSKEPLSLLNQEKILNDFYQKLKALPYDSKCDKLLELLSEIYENNSNEKILIFTQFVDTLFYLKELLQKQNYHVDIFYGGLDKEQKDKAVESFRNAKSFSIMISTEIGGEGRNFQFARVLVNYDLPWNPMKLEQRIGRLDRIGQESKEIYIYNFFLEGTIETDIVYVLNKRINLFEESIGLLEPIIGKIEKEIKEIIFTDTEGKKRKKLNEFYRNLDNQFQRAKEIEMQLDDLMIDKKSFQVDDLITSLASCEEVKLSHNELFLLMKYFFSINESKYGTLEIQDNEPNKIHFQSKIQLNEELLKKLNYNIANEYIGTFDLNLAREREEIDFFALGHTLINNILDFCISESFEGTFTFLFLKKDMLFEDLKNIFDRNKELYLFTFKIKFQGYILENQFIAVVVDEDGNEIKDLTEYVLNIENFHKIFKFNQKVEDNVYLDQKLLQKLSQQAKSFVKRRTSKWKQEIKALNDKIFNLYQQKKQKIYNHKRKVLNLKLEILNQKLERKKRKIPTEKQMRNIANLDDEVKKQEKLYKIKLLEEEISVLEKDIKKVDKKLDELLFEFEDLKYEMVKRNLAKFYTNLNSLAIIKLAE